MTAVVDGGGYLAFTIKHCSSYVLSDAVISSAGNNDILGIPPPSSKTGVPQITQHAAQAVNAPSQGAVHTPAAFELTENPPAESKMPACKTNIAAYILLVLGIALVSSSATLLILGKKA